MKRITIRISGLVLFMGLFFSLAFAQESLTISTYYPSPYGSYGELRAQKVAIGDNYTNGAQYCWAGTGVCTNIIPAAADLVVEGNVGIGTSNPSTNLDVNGQVRIRGGTPAAGKYLYSNDGSGNATWKQPGKSSTTGSDDCYWQDISNPAGPGTFEAECNDGYYVRGERVYLDNADWIPHARWLKCCKF